MALKRTTRGVVIGLVSAIAAAVLAGGTAAATYRTTSASPANLLSHPVTTDYFDVTRTTAGYIPGL